MKFIDLRVKTKLMLDAATRRAIAARNLVRVTEPKDVELEKAAESLKQQAAGLLNLAAAFETAGTHGAAFA